MEVRAVEPMTPNMTVENTDSRRLESSPSIMSPLKRKVGEGESGLSNADGKENGGVDKKAKTEASSSAPLVELKGRKLTLKQEALSRNIPRRRLLNFEGYLLDEADAQREIVEIPEEHWDLIVMAGHEQSSSSEGLLVKHIRAALNINEANLPTKAIESLIPKLFTLQQYGFVPSDFASSSSVSKLPAGLQIRCWEANEVERYFPSEQHLMLELRRVERVRARQECLRILDGLDDIEKLELVKGDKLEKGEKAKAKSKIEEDVKVPDAVQDSPRPTARRQSREGTANTVDSRRSLSPTKKSKMTPEEEEAARVKKEEREAKKAAVAEKKAAKDREEKKREAAKAKQIQTMNAFFKPKATPSPSISRASPAGPSTLKADSTPKVSDYAKAFRPMAQRPHVHVAEYNRWRKRRGRDGSVDVFSEVVVEQGGAGPSKVKDWQPHDFLADHLHKHGRRVRSARSHLPQGFKVMPSHGTVADVWNAVQDAEDPREVLDQLKDRTKYPWKTLAFDQQTRPPYCGTFTKKSVVVGPRTPFAQDPIFDYSYDSSDDWQDDEGGEDVEDFGEANNNGGAEDEETEDEEEGEFDDFFDDTEDVEFTPLPGDVEDGVTPGMDQTRLPTSMKVVKRAREVPKKVVKLNQYWKGPIWEKKIGEVGTDGLEEYRIQLLNDTPIAIDPFTFTSSDPEQRFKPSFTTTAIGTSLTVRCLLSADPIVVPVKPIAATPPKSAPLANPNANFHNSPNSSSIDHPSPKANSNSSTLPTLPAPPATVNTKPGPRIAFPPSHLADLLRAIEGSTKIRTDLISILRDKFESVATKAAIEAKLKEVAVREGKSKDSPWRVRAAAWMAAGLTPPTKTLTKASPLPQPIHPQTQPQIQTQVHPSTPPAPPNSAEPIVID